MTMMNVVVKGEEGKVTMGGEVNFVEGPAGEA